MNASTFVILGQGGKVAFHLDALSSGLALNVDVDTTLTVIAGNLYRLLARSLKRYMDDRI